MTNRTYVQDFLANISTAEDAQAALRDIAQAFNESASELQSSWQDKNAGRCWTRMARYIDKAADVALS